MSAVKLPSHNLAIFLVPLLEPIATNLYTVENSFEFVKTITYQDPGLFMDSPDVESHFINIQLEETINVSCDSLFSNDRINNNRIDFEKLSRVAPQSVFNLEGKIYKKKSVELVSDLN